MRSLLKHRAASQAKASTPLLSSDRLLTLAGFAVAALAAFFPWYVFLNQGSLGIRSEGLRLDGHRVGTPGLERAFVPSRRERDRVAVARDYDAMITATVPKVPQAPKQPAAQGPEAQPFPGRPFSLVHVANGQALIADEDGMYVVHVGSKLPDESELAAIEKRDGAWVIRTSRGDVVGP